MALLFDGSCCGARLAGRGVTRVVLAAAGGLTEAKLALVFKDQRELSMRDVSAFAELLGVSVAEAASRAGVRPAPPSDGQRIAALGTRVSALEAELAALKG
jgi:hypothetical protein